MYSTFTLVRDTMWEIGVKMVFDTVIEAIHEPVACLFVYLGMVVSQESLDRIVVRDRCPCDLVVALLDKQLCPSEAAVKEAASLGSCVVSTLIRQGIYPPQASIGMAAQHGHLETVRAMLDGGMYAPREILGDAVYYILSYRASQTSQKAMNEAVYKNHYEIVRQLCMVGKRVSAKTLRAVEKKGLKRMHSLLTWYGVGKQKRLWIRIDGRLVRVD